MSLLPQVAYLVPPETERVARAAFPRPSTFMQMRDHLGMIYHDQTFADLFPLQGQPAYSPFRLILTLIMQFAENLSDRQAADAVRSRIDWKFALALDLTDPGFDASILTEFRSRLITGSREHLLLTTLLDLFRVKGLLKQRGKQRTDSTHVLARVRDLNRLEFVGETMRATLNALALVAPAWLTALAPGDWFERYSERCEEYRLPDSAAKRDALARTIGGDGLTLLQALDAPSAPAATRNLDAVAVLRQVWAEQFIADGPKVRWRTAEETPQRASMIASPYDPEARYSTKRETNWVGYKVHLTESCDEDAPQLITQVTTTPATTPDGAVLEQIHVELAQHKLSPSLHLVDTGYVDGEARVRSREKHEISLVGPVPPDTSWQARTGKGFDVSGFEIDWEAKRAQCPEGQVSTGWKESGPDRHGHAQVKISFAQAVCGRCGARSLCTRGQTTGRELTVRPEAEHKSLQAAREEQQTEEWKELYGERAGIEGSLSAGVRRHGLREARYLGLAKTHLQHILIAVAMNIVRVVAWLSGDVRATTRRSAFARLAPSTSIC